VAFGANAEIAARRPELRLVLHDLAQGCMRIVLNGIVIENTEDGIIIQYDVRDPAFYAAVFLDNDRAVAGEISSHDLKRLRRYIIEGKGAVPMGQGL
jgi:hypothetical protein